MQRFSLWVAAILLLSTTLVAGTIEYIPASGGSSAASIVNASRMFLCSTGIIPGGGQGSDGRYEWTCGNYPWSAHTGGVDADGVGVPDEALFSGGATELIDCTGSGTGERRSDGVAVEVESCVHDGEVLRLNALADAFLAIDNARPEASGACTVFFPEGLYHFEGCGETTDGTNIRCPTPRPPYNTGPVRTLSWYGRTICGEGPDVDGPMFGALPTYLDQDLRPVRTGTVFIKDTGPFNGTQIDPNGDSAQINGDGVLFLGGAKGTINQCVPVSTSDPRCNARDSNRLNSQITMPNQLWGVEADAEDANAGGAGTSVLSGNEFCIDNDASTSGTCRLDRRIRCTTAGNADRTGVSTGGCRFPDSNGIDLGPCEGFVDALEYDTNTGNQDLVVTINGLAPQPDDDNSTEEFTVQARYAEDSSLTACNTTGGKLVSFGSFGTTRDSQMIRNMAPTTSTDLRFSVGSRENSFGQLGARGITVMNSSWVDRFANDANKDTESDGTVTSPAATSFDGGGSPTWTVNEFVGMSVIVRTSALTMDQGCSSNCQEQRRITANDGNTITFSHALTTGALAGAETFRISSFSCPHESSYSVSSNADACDTAYGIRVGSFSSVGELQNMQIWHMTVDMPGNPIKAFKISKSIFTGLRQAFCHDVASLEVEDSIFYDNFCNGASIYITGFGAQGGVYRSKFINNMGSSIITTVAGGRTSVLEDIEFIGNDTLNGVINLHTAQLQARNLRFTNNTGGPNIAINPQADQGATVDVDFENLIFSGAQSYQTACGNSVTCYGAAPIVISSLFHSAAYNGRLDRVSFRNLTWYLNNTSALGVGSTQPCGIYLSNWASANYLNDYGKVRIEGYTIRNDGGIDTPVACTADLDGSTLRDQSDDAGIGTLRPPPVIIGAVVNGVPVAEQPNAGVTVAGFGDCDNYWPGYTQLVYNQADTACTDADTDGDIDGTGTAMAQCVCNATNDVVPAY